MLKNWSLTFETTNLSNSPRIRYGQVIVVIGVNPNKTYQVTPIQRVEILRKMLDSKKMTRNVRVEGMCSKLFSCFYTDGFLANP